MVNTRRKKAPHKPPPPKIPPLPDPPSSRRGQSTSPSSAKPASLSSQRPAAEIKTTTESPSVPGSPRSEQPEASSKKSTSVTVHDTEIEDLAHSVPAADKARATSTKVAESAARHTESGSISDADSADSSSWANLVKTSGTKMKRKGESFILESGELCVKIPDEVIIRNKNRWDKFIIAQFNGNAPSPGALHAITNGIWSNKLRDITVSKLSEKAFLIRIPNIDTRKRVLAQGMWHIDNQSMFVAKWEPGLKPTLPTLTSAPIWLDFRGVPPHFFHEEGLEHIAGMLGKPLFMHPSTANMTNLEVARVYTIILGGG